MLSIGNPPQQHAGLHEIHGLDPHPTREGRWEVLPFKSGVLAVHAVLLSSTAKVLFFAGSGSSPVRFASPDFGNEAKVICTSVVWDATAPSGPGATNFSHPAMLRGADGKPFCQRSSNNPQMRSVNSPHPRPEGGRDGA